MRQLSIQVTIYKSKPLKVKVWPSTQSLGSHRTASCKWPQKLLVLNHSDGKTNGLIYIKMKNKKNKYELHQQTTTAVHQIPDLGQVQTIAAILNILMVPNLLPFLKQYYSITSQHRKTHYKISIGRLNSIN